MYLVRIGELSRALSCQDLEIDDYVFIDKDKVYDKLSQSETREFWNCVNQEIS
ncbi:hypothetical protein [Anaeromicropila herbilytica]|uniref:Uncharacterized protein n=1 Tax=Anaeromicropila herbilytica TaxID=2785025 RepID=A0A7R7ICS8_9FIRM|nr:hypothetical protein [Anaeromicropila herbilytica]BCN31068.1 hypothetical protein bsdtb5_23630 [Anaeromicropila herbilytica]